MKEERGETALPQVPRSFPKASIPSGCGYPNVGEFVMDVDNGSIISAVIIGRVGFAPYRWMMFVVSHPLRASSLPIKEQHSCSWP